MENILYEIFHNQYNAHLPQTEAQWKTFSKLHPLEEKIKQAFGLEFLDQFSTLRLELEAEQDYSCFRSGFLLGARLMLEALEV